MYSYTYDEETGGILLNSTPTVFSKEPRPVYAPELDMLGFDKHWNYDKQSDVPYMWAESVQYWYRGRYDWATHPHIQEKIRDLAKADYEAGGSDKAINKINSWGKDELRDRLIALVKENMALGIEIINGGE